MRKIVSMTLSNVIDTKKIADFLVGNITKTQYKSKDENPPRHSEARKIKDLQKILWYINEFLMLLIFPYVVSQFKIIRMYLYSNMKPFQTNLKWVIKKYLCGLHESFPGGGYASYYFMLSETSKYIFSYNFNTISLDFYTCF